MRKITLEENRKFQIDVLDAICSFCDKNDIKYFLIAGTLLGAVRHKGYIPWDDDIDIAMLRDDYELFVKTFKTDGYYAVAPEINTSGYFLPFAKVCKDKTQIIENTKTMKIKLGINVDVFPIDVVSDDPIERKRHLGKIRRQRKLIDIIDTPLSNTRTWYKNIALALLQIVLLPISPQKVITKIVNYSKMYSNMESSLCAEVAWGCGEREVVSRNVFESVQKIAFEGKMYNAPAGWDEWLSNRYGDYMKLPPLNQQRTHHECNAYILD